MALNRFSGIGNLGKDAELRQAGGSSVASFSIAITEKWKDKSGQQQERTEWVNCAYWGKGGEAVAPHLVKGKQVYVEGKLQTRSFEKDGQKHFRTEVNVERLQLLGGGNSGGGGPRGVGRSQSSDDGGYDGPGGGVDDSDPPPF